MELSICGDKFNGWEKYMLKALKKIPYKYDISILTIILVFSIIEKVHINRVFFNNGLANINPLNAFPILIIYEVVKIVLLFVYAIVGVLISPKKENQLLQLSMRIMFSILIYFGTCLFPFISGQPGDAYFLKGFEKWVLQNVDIDAIQTWIQSEESDEYLGKEYAGESLQEEIPDFVKNFDPEFVFFYDYDSETGKSIVLGWSTLGGTWGIVIGPPTMKVQTEGTFQKDVDNVERRHLIKPGVYIYSEG